VETARKRAAVARKVTKANTGSDRKKAFVAARVANRAAVKLAKPKRKVKKKRSSKEPTVGK
jgi:hypothetical protein